MKQITYEQIVAFEPCGLYGEDDGVNYTPARIRQLMDGREYVTPREIYDCQDVPWVDKYWLLSKLLPEPDKHELACRVAETCEIKNDELRARRDALIQAKRAWIAGKIDSEELEAYRAAYRAAYWDVDLAADWAADWAAYWDVDWAAYWAADSVEAYRAFCDIALEMME